MKGSGADVCNFVVGRPDWGMFVSVFACLMKDVIKCNTTMPRDALLQSIESHNFERTAAALQAQRGHAVHPTLVVRQLPHKAAP